MSKFVLVFAAVVGLVACSCRPVSGPVEFTGVAVGKVVKCESARSAEYPDARWLVTVDADGELWSYYSDAHTGAAWTVTLRIDNGKVVRATVDKGGYFEWEGLSK